MIEKNNKIINILMVFGTTIPMSFMVGFGFIIAIVIIGGISDFLERLLDAKLWWVFVIISYISLSIYFMYKTRIDFYRERKKRVNALIIYLKEWLIENSRPEPSEKEIKLIREFFIERIDILACSDRELWNNNFSNEEYPKSLFGIVDIFIKAYYKDHDNWMKAYSSGMRKHASEWVERR
jgi:energy-coupling factor transporter transmembrane protein EcfT